MFSEEFPIFLNPSVQAIQDTPICSLLKRRVLKIEREREQ